MPGWGTDCRHRNHAQLNTRRKLFSPATTSFNDSPNSHVALFDLAIPGSQPVFQPETLIPAVRAAHALQLQHPARKPLRPEALFPLGPAVRIPDHAVLRAVRERWMHHAAREGRDAPQDGDGIQGRHQTGADGARYGEDDCSARWHALVGFQPGRRPLIEIITLPEIHYPATAAALVRKVQLLLKAVDACVSGMEAGGLRADVNVSVRKSDDLTGTLGTRTEIKNLSSFKAVEDAIIAERDRQIRLLEGRGVVLGETRGWSLGSTETRRLRGKEGEVDYRYMPDPDLGPVIIDDALVRHLKESVGVLPDKEADHLIERYRLSSKDALALMQLDGEGRLEYFYNVLAELHALLAEKGDGAAGTPPTGSIELLAANWCLHELGKLTEVSSDLEMTSDGECRVPSKQLSQILFHLHQHRITARIAKEMLWVVYRGDLAGHSVTEFIEQEGLWFRELSDEEYVEIADGVLEQERKFSTNSGSSEGAKNLHTRRGSSCSLSER